ncbi:hypothetical protein, partial [Enterobacter hormaechei]|uniref:hypothetical protein n=1 Tax=Enterobacter hormaechei TaxID=158836 RepID=UPI001954C8FE
AQHMVAVDLPEAVGGQVQGSLFGPRAVIARDAAFPPREQQPANRSWALARDRRRVSGRARATKP